MTRLSRQVLLSNFCPLAKTSKAENADFSESDGHYSFPLFYHLIRFADSNIPEDVFIVNL